MDSSAPLVYKSFSCMYIVKASNFKSSVINDFYAVVMDTAFLL